MIIAASCIITGCYKNTKTLNERLSLWRNDKIPYGTYYAYQNLTHIFKDAKVVVNKRSPERYSLFNIREGKKYDESLYGNTGTVVYLIIGQSVIPDASEVNALREFAGQGNHVFISAIQIGEVLMDSLRLTAQSAFIFRDSLRVKILDPVSRDSIFFTYPGMSLDKFLVHMDTSVTEILGTNENGKANFVKFNYKGGGSLYVHLAPAAFTNFFLLHKNNKTYYDDALSYLPANTKIVNWDDYFRYHQNGREKGLSARNRTFSKLGVFFKDPVLRWAVWLSLVLFLIIYLFESKRKQRIIPVMLPLQNASVDFVKTIGRLYFQRRDNKNLASKMSSHFLDHVRNTYNIPTSPLDEEFVKRLSYKSGLTINVVRDIVNEVKGIDEEFEIGDKHLLQLSNKLENFYKRP